MTPTELSIIIPVHNEEDSILPLHDRLVEVLDQIPQPYEIVFVDDASTDGSAALLRNLVESSESLRVVRLRRNFGQTAALAAGFAYSAGDVIIAMDGDLQHLPEDIPALLAKIDEGYDVASGWRAERIDGFFTRRLPSRIANWLMARVSGVELHDFGTTFKAYRREVLADIRLYGELHRFIPALVAMRGASIAEVPIANVERGSGRSHYGLGRTFRVIFDIITMWFLQKYLTRPMHFFGPIGALCGVSGGLILAGLVVRKLQGITIMTEHGPLLIAGAVLLLAGLQTFFTGLIGEVLMRTYFESQDRAIYAVRDIWGGETEDEPSHPFADDTN